MIEALQRYHPLVIEGMGGYDPRNPDIVAAFVINHLHNYWRDRPPSKPVLLITQGDPFEEKGIAAVTRRVANELNVSRGLIFLDPEIADYHLKNADRQGVIFEIPYSAMAHRLEASGAGVTRMIADAVSAALNDKNAQRLLNGRSVLPSYYRDFAMLQEVTKIACKQICGEITIAHTSLEISPFSVTSFCHVGLEMGFIDAVEMAVFGSSP